MGSVIARLFVETYPQYVDGLILSGTGMYSLWKGLPTVKVLQLITKFMVLRNELNGLTS